MRAPLFRTLRWLAAAAVCGFVFGYVGEAAALDRQPAVGGVAGGASRGYGAERPGYGGERDYYGASNLRSAKDDARGYDRNGYRSHGSVIEFDDHAYDYPEGGAPYEAGRETRAGVYPGFGSGAGSVVYLGDQNAGRDDEPDVTLPTGPRIIDVEAERLDRRPVGKGEVSVSYLGGAKIIRIGAGETERAKRDVRPVLAPWSEAWERYCGRAFPDFDPERGTYTATDGSTRFCTGG
jgi:hypothetical protein